MSSTRREFLRDSTLLVGSITGLISTPFLFVWINDRNEAIKRESETYFGKYVQKVGEGRFPNVFYESPSYYPIYDISYSPNSRHVRLIPLEGRTTSERVIHLGEEPRLKGLQFVDYGALNTEYAVPVFGEPYSAAIGSSKNVEGHVSLINKLSNGYNAEVGIWLMLSDRNGNPVTPSGQAIDLKTQKPFYTPDGYDFI